MNPELIKKYLQNYLDNVVALRINKRWSDHISKPIEFSVHDIIKGSYQPPIIHVFLDTEPEIRKKPGLRPWVLTMMGEVDKDISGFFRLFSIIFRIKLHWNQRPIFKNDTLHTEN